MATPLGSVTEIKQNQKGQAFISAASSTETAYNFFKEANNHKIANTKMLTDESVTA